MKHYLWWILLALPLVIASWIFLRVLGRGFLAFIFVAFFVLVYLIALLLFFFADRILLRWYHANELRDEKAPIYELVRRGAQKAGIPAPRVCIVDSAMPTAFATGRSPVCASIVVTKALLEVLDREELEAVLMHELVLIKNGDTRLGSMVAVISGLLTGLVTVAFWCSIFTGFGQEDDPAPNLIKFFVTSLVAPAAALFIQLMITPARVYRADEESVRLYGKSDSLIHALEKLEQRLSSATYEVNPSHVHLFFMNPLHDDDVVVMDFHLPTYHFLFRTHPSTQRRLTALQVLQANKSEEVIRQCK
ncbi:MAG: protease [Methanophagales archaeon ANME-1-THS]|nr:MAG: protease [Methanophagales archaeon ANME-1-THS]